MRTTMFLLFTAMLVIYAVSCDNDNSKTPTEPEVGIEAYVFTDFRGYSPEEYMAMLNNSSFPMYLPVAMEYNVVTKSPYYAEGRVKFTGLGWLDFSTENLREFWVIAPDSLRTQGYRHFQFGQTIVRADTMTGYWFKNNVMIDFSSVPFIAVKQMYYE